MRKKDNAFSPTIDGMSILEDSNTGNETATVAEQRNYSVLNVSDAKKISRVWLQAAQLENAIDFGLPEVDDRYHVWRVPLLKKATKERVGEVVIDAHTSLVLENKSTSPESLEARLLGREENSSTVSTHDTRKGIYKLST